MVLGFGKTPFVKGGRGDLDLEDLDTKSSALSGTSFAKEVFISSDYRSLI
jgi:hypothetical protein